MWAQRRQNEIVCTSHGTTAKTVYNWLTVRACVLCWSKLSVDNTSNYSFSTHCASFGLHDSFNQTKPNFVCKVLYRFTNTAWVYVEYGVHQILLLAGTVFRCILFRSSRLLHSPLTSTSSRPNDWHHTYNTYDTNCVHNRLFICIYYVRSLSSSG